VASKPISEMRVEEMVGSWFAGGVVRGKEEDGGADKSSAAIGGGVVTACIVRIRSD
jgi:hypothetical protein